MTWRWMARPSERSLRRGPRRPADFNSSTPAARSRIRRITIPSSDCATDVFCNVNFFIVY